MAVLLLCGICYGVTYVSYNRAVQFVQDLPQYSGKIKHVFLRFQKQAEVNSANDRKCAAGWR